MRLLVVKPEEILRATHQDSLSTIAAAENHENLWELSSHYH